jgi:hypothetical protein
MPLVRNNEKDSRLKVQNLKGRISDLHQRLDEYQKMMVEMPSVTLAKAAAVREDELRLCEKELELENSEIAKNAIFDKSDFFNKLDLDTYEGRSAANLYLRNLETRVRAGFNGHEHFFVAVTGSERQSAQFAIFLNENLDVKTIPLTQKMTVNVINQGDLSNVTMYKPLVRLLPELLAATEGNGRKPITIDLATIPEIEFVPVSSAAAKLLRSLGLKPVDK